MRLIVPLLLTSVLLPASLAFAPSILQQRQQRILQAAKRQEATTSSSSLDTLVQNVDKAFQECQDDVAKQCKVKVAVSAANHRLGLVATQPISRGDVALAMPFDDRYVLTAGLAAKLFKEVLPEGYDGWTGDAGLIALLLLNQVALSSDSGGGLPIKGQSGPLQSFLKAWVASLPTPVELDHHPLLWSEDDQEALQSSSTNKIYRRLDDIEEDASWLVKNVFEKDRETFPETVTIGDATLDCFSENGFKWAMALALSRTFFLDGALRLIPFLDLCNHADDDTDEMQSGGMGPFGSLKGAKLISAQKYQVGDEVYCSYGPKSAADYLMEYGFCPESSWKTAVSELSFEIDQEKDRFCDDKLDILEFETYDQAPMDPVQSFDVVSAIGRDGEPDPALLQFLRLVKLGGQDAFMLESIFRKEVWGFMEMPVSEANELAVMNAILQACQDALNEMAECPEGGPSICQQLRESETRALSRTLEFVQREREALDLKEYYQERRLKDLGLDSEWTPEDEYASDDLGFGQTRAPGGADYDW